MSRFYPIENSPLFKLQSKGRLAKLLRVERKELPSLCDGSSYRIFEKESVGRKPRLVEQPVGRLGEVHRQMFSLLARIILPEYVFSGKRGVSYLDNARHHQPNGYVLKIDIQRFYPSTQTEYVFRFFRHRLLIAEDVAWVMANMFTCGGHIPTGSPVSQLLAYWSYSRFFDEIESLAMRGGMTFSLYVDDIVFSSALPITKKFKRTVESKLKSVSLKAKASKVKFRNKREFKLITGCTIGPDGRLLVPNKLQKKIFDMVNENPNFEKIKAKQARSLLGRLTAARSIEADFFDATYHKLKRALARAPHTSE